MIGSEILGIGMHVPSNVVTNHDLEKIIDTSDEWIVRRTGIKERRWADASVDTPSGLALKASEIAIEKAGIKKEDIDCIIYATLSPDHDFPGTGCFLQAKLGISGIPAIDIRQQCTGFIYGMTIADQFIKNGMYKKILLVGAEIHSFGLDKTTRGRDISVLFGDGAGAIIMSANEVNDKAKDSHIYSGHLHADGAFAKELWLPAPGNALGLPERINAKIMEEGLHHAYMNGKKVFVHAVKRMCEVLGECLQHNNVKLEDVDIFFFHQANLRINEKIAEMLNIPSEKIYNTIQKYGNTTAATIPIGMSEALDEGKLEKGMLVATVAFGSGFTWAANLFRY